MADISELLDAHERKSLLRFLMCGSVDDGKSTLIGRLLYETQALYVDQLAALEDDSRRAGTQGGELDFALLTDGLAAEREQGITIDVAYRHFSTERRHFIVADAPGHEQYTRNMVTGASTADCAVILIDAGLGVSRQTRRHSYLVALLGIEHVAVAVNKMDTVDYSQERFDEIERAYAGVLERIEFSGEATCIPVSALRGANVLRARRAHSLVRGADADGVPGARRGRALDDREAVPDARPVGQPGVGGLPRASPARSSAGRSPRATRSWPRPQAGGAGSSGSSPPTVTSTGRSPGRR